MKDVVWVRWYEMYADGITPSDDEHYNYQWYNKGTLTLDEVSEMIEMDLDDSVYGREEEHYRGIHWEIIELPPKSYIADQLKYYNSLNAHTVSMIEYYKGLEDVE